MAIDKILLVSSEPFIRKSIEECLRLRRYAVHGAGTLADAERFLQRDFFDLVLLETQLPDGAGLDLAERLLSEPRQPLLALLGPANGLETVGEGIRMGAFDYLLKPFSLTQVELLVRKAEAFQQMVRLNQHLNAAGLSEPAITCEHPAMLRLQAQLRRVAPTEATVLIEGEPGTGKTHCARQLYQESSRSGKPYLEVDCRALPEDQLESLLFGQERSELPGGHERREGRLELAHGGTLLLKAVELLPLRLQEKLLRFLLTKEFDRRGSTRSLRADVRLLATVEGGLLDAVDRGVFLENLFYRLNVLPLKVPALRERGSDVLRLAHGFLARFQARYGKAATLSAEGQAAVQQHAWPGNVRELELVLERAVLTLPAGTALGAAELGLSSPVPKLSSQESGTAFAPMHELERQHIFRAIDHARGNRTKAADLLGISVRTLRNKLHEYAALGEEEAS